MILGKCLWTKIKARKGVEKSNNWDVYYICEMGKVKGDQGYSLTPWPDHTKKRNKKKTLSRLAAEAAEKELP